MKTQTSVAAATVFLIESLAFAALSRWEHNYAIRPSSLLNLYLVFSVGLDFVRMRTCKHRFSSFPSSGVSVESSSCTFALVRPTLVLPVGVTEIFNERWLT